MNQAARRIAALSAATGLLTVATLANTGTAMAEDDVLRLSAHDQVAAPGTAPRLSPEVESGTPDGKTVIAFSTKPLTGPAGDGAGVPKGFTAQANDCTEVAGLVAVYVCGPSGLRPGFAIPKDTPDTAVHWGFAYVPQGGDLAAGIEAARTAGATPADATHGSAKVVVKTAASAALNTVAFDLPDVPSGGTVRQQLRVHANDAGNLTLRFRPADGYLWRNPGDIRIGGLTTQAGATCTQPSTTLLSSLVNLDCRLEPGDHTIGYELTTPSGAYMVKLVALTGYDIYDFRTQSSDVRQTSAPFTALGKPVLVRHGLLARDTTGTLLGYNGTGAAGAPLAGPYRIGTGWQAYNALTSLSPYKQGSYYWADMKPSAVTRGLGDLVARDGSGTLWYYDRQLGYESPFAPRVKVGAGWNIYDRIDGAGDLDRDGSVDLLARDKTGVLWLYKGTGSFTGARFKTRVKVGAGWGTYDRLAGGADLTGDGRADLLARDKTEVLWLYRGTGSGTAPYATRTRIGAGWGVYDQLVVAGDLTDDGRADVVARDRTGVLWLYRGTGNTGAPFVTRTKVGGGWNTYNHLF
ncbi:VCBS repeat protein [Streptomyces sp. PanSC19]|uniref:FG-GAP repeat domain-containing protein n=1 Tax=Streptomyces sp. PanSC19 TaxID=1520455 RepID=UPI000FA1621A|nr:VCBS repeat-containing protein [Streptomyces sp. PanSC19]ROQ23615.1 VCBS repeat protein [Streptomyces sp. PanSC19]